MLDIDVYILWLNNLFSNNSIYYNLFIVNIAYNIGIFSVVFFNYVTYRKQYAIYFFLLSAGITFCHVSFAFYFFGLLNPQFYYIGIHLAPLLSTWGMYIYMTKLLDIPTSRYMFYLHIFHALLTIYISFFFPTLSTISVVIHFINLGLTLLILAFVIKISFKTYQENKLEKIFFILGTIVVVTMIMLYFPATDPNIVYPIKFVTLFVNTFFNAYFIGYLNARDDEQTTLQQAKAIKLAKENQFLLLNQQTILEKQVAERTLELQKTNTLKDKLFATIGHDLRNAVITLKMSLNIFDKKVDDDNTYQVQKQVDELYTTLDNLLEWSILQLNKNKSIVKSFPIKDGVDDCLEFLNYNLLSKNIRVIVAIEDLSINVNEHQLSIILRNIISNAIKFTPTNGFIRISTHKIESYVELCIADSGIGMPPILLNTLFSDISFQSRIGTDGEKGTGLGLKLCKELIENHGGILEIDSEVNKGTTVKIKFLV